MARGSIKKRENKDGTVTYYIRYRTPSGKQVMTAIGPKKRQAEAALEEVMKTIRDGTYIEKKSITFGEIVDKWLKIKEAEVENGQIRPVTYAAYKAACGRLKEFVTVRNKKEEPIAWLKDYRLRAINPELCEKVCAEIAQNFMPATRSKNVMVFKSILDTAVKWGYLVYNPAQHVKNIKIPKREMDCLTIDELVKIISNVRKEYVALVLTAMMSGLRLSEVLGLRWGDIDFNSGYFHVRNVVVHGKFYTPKTDKSHRNVMIGETLLEELKLHQVRQAVEVEKNPYDLVFPGKDGNPLNARNISRRVLHPAIKLAGLRRIERPFHALRHSYLTALADIGVDIKTIQEQAGHSSAKISWDIYIHRYPNKDRDKIKQLDESFKNKLGKQNFQKCDIPVRMGLKKEGAD